MTGLMPRCKTRRRCVSWSYPRSVRTASGRCLGRPTVLAAVGILASRGSNWVALLRFPPVRASGARWTGLGPRLGPAG